MTPYRSASLLKLAIIWKDDEMIELAVTASNGRYSGTTAVYDRPEALLDLALALTNFPGKDQVLIYEAGTKAGYAFCAFRFYPVGPAGHIGVAVCLEQDGATGGRPQEKGRVQLELLTVPAAIDTFRKALYTLALRAEGQAVLYGHDTGPVYEGG